MVNVSKPVVEKGQEAERTLSMDISGLAEKTFNDKERVIRVFGIAQILIINEMRNINLGDEKNIKMAPEGNKDGYHNRLHVFDVLKTAMELANRLKISEKDKELLFIAAAGHDVGFNVRYDNNEVLGAMITYKVMSQEGFRHSYVHGYFQDWSPSDIKTVGDIIVRGTTTYPLEGGKLGFQQKPETRLEKIISLADVYNFFRIAGDDRNFFELGNALNKEIAAKNGKEYKGPTAGSDAYAIQLLKNYKINDAGYDKQFLATLEHKRQENINALEARSINF